MTKHPKAGTQVFYRVRNSQGGELGIWSARHVLAHVAYDLRHIGTTYIVVEPV